MNAFRMIQVVIFLRNVHNPYNVFQFILSLVTDHYDRLGWNDEGSLPERRNRVDVLGLACKNGHAKCLKAAGVAFTMWIDDPTFYIPPNLRTLVYK